MQHVRTVAMQRRQRDEVRCRQALAEAGISVDLGLLATRLMEHQVTVNFHPDRVARDGRTAAESLRDNGVYHNQYRTGTSAGSLTAYAGGQRESWERRLFGAEAAALPPDQRPRYGGLNAAGHADGACPRFGSCYLVLNPSVSNRITLVVDDSHRSSRAPESADVGTVDEPMGLLAGLLERAAHHQALQLAGGIGPVIDRILRPGPDASQQASADVGRALDQYIEAQVHGPVSLATDVARLVIDPSFQDTDTGDNLIDAATRYGVHLVRHPGFALAATDLDRVPHAFRGADVIELGRRTLSVHGAPITAATIGALAREPAAGREPLRQRVKQLWHVLVAFGRSPA